MARETRGRGSRLRKTWHAMQATPFDNVSVSTTQVAVGAFSWAETIEATILRTRGEFLIVSTPDAATDSDQIALGLCVVRDAAVTVGGTSLPSPIADAQDDIWLWHSVYALDAMGATAEDPQSSTAYVRFTIDSKAMRKFPKGSAYVLLAEGNTGEFASVFVSGFLRFLVGS